MNITFAKIGYIMYIFYHECIMNVGIYKRKFYTIDIL